MYPRFAFSLLFSVCAFGLGIAIPAFPSDERCGQNAVFLECGSACAPDCKNRLTALVCTLQCVTGCFCREGYLKNELGQCVQPHECDGQTHKLPFQIPSASFPTCPDNEEFQACGSACAPTCSNPQPSPVCTKNCVVGCFCKQGHLRNSQGVCVPALQCEAKPSMLFAYPPEMSQCKENEIFLTCGSACSPTCANPHPGPACTLQCVAGCFCQPGYLKNEQGVCVSSVQCGVPANEAMPLPPQICEENEEFRQCKGCDGTCDKPNPICPRICVRGCACKQGHVRTGSNGRCVPTEQCPKVNAAQMIMRGFVAPKCGANMEWRTCGTACPATCANPQPSPACTKNCVMGCFCQDGYLKTEKGECVAAANCDAQKPVEVKCNSEREFYTDDCGTQLDCMATCHTPPAFLIHGYPQVPKKCLERKCAPSCVCKHPYVRNSNGQCVERNECDGQATTVPSQ